MSGDLRPIRILAAGDRDRPPAGDGPAQDVIGPAWTKRKREVLNAIDQELARRDSWQGKRFG